MARYTVENTVSIGRPVKVFCDGVEVSHVVEADDVEGWAVVWDLDEDGEFSTTAGHINYRRISGEIRVEGA